MSQRWFGFSFWGVCLWCGCFGFGVLVWVVSAFTARILSSVFSNSFIVDCQHLEYGLIDTFEMIFHINFFMYIFSVLGDILSASLCIADRIYKWKIT